MKKLLMFIGLIVSLPGLATVTISNPDCPIQFEGSVKEIIKEVGPDRPLARQKVVFDNHHTIKGEVKEKVLLDVLQNAFTIVKGEDYRVQMRDGRLCWIEKL